MNVRYSISCVLAALAASTFTAGCDGEKADPKTAGKSDLNPPGLLETVTRDGKIELRWSAGNVEEDFKGYYVFAMKKSDYDTKAKGKVKFPASADPSKSGIPRCQDNSPWFEAFGLPASTAECEADKATPASGTKLTDNGTALADSSSSTSTEKSEKLTGFVLCDETIAKGGKEPSLAVASPAVSTQKCTVSKLGDGKTALENGVTYVFFVAAVAEDDLSVVSWTSNLVSDTPSKDSPVETPVTLATNQFATITIDTTAKTVTLNAAQSCVTNVYTTCEALATPNTDNPATPTIFISRTKSSSGTFPQRLFISTAQGKTVQLQPRGPQTYDPLTGTKVARIPGDQAAAVSSYPTAGTKYIVYNNQVFDFAVTQGTDVYYGKVVIGDVTYASAAANSDATLKVSVIFQPTAGVRDYFVEPAAD